MSDVEALPVAEPVSAEVGEQQVAEPVVESPEKPEGETKDETKPEKTPEQREIARMQRKIDRLVRQREEARAQIGAPRLQEPPIGDTNRQAQDDSDTLSLSRAELQRLVQEQASRLAPAIKEQQAEIEHRASVVRGLAQTWGQEKFDALASDLDDVFGGLADHSGRPKPATDAIFESENPSLVIEYLADPDHADEAEVIARMGPIQAGRAIAKLEAKIQAAKAEAKPKKSSAPAPIEASRGQGTAPAGYHPNMTDAQYAAWRKSQRGR